MLIQSTRFGQIEVDDSEIIHFPHALPGFPEEKKFALLPYLSDSPFAFLQSLNEPNLTFVVVEPFAFFKDYSFSLDDTVAAELGLSNDNPPKILNIVRIPENMEEITANLQAPIIINCKTRSAIQLILEKSPYAVRHRLFTQGTSTNPEKRGE